jgi:NAD(P)-dependent dehydrogenase (short-subunit alcohol dehydrogenase family)
MVARAEAELGPVSILVNNAGVSSPATLEISTDIEINRTGASNTTLRLQLGGPKRASVSTTNYDPINARILLLHCVHSSDKGREDDQF